MNAYELAVSEFGQETADRWLETGRLVETVLPKLGQWGGAKLVYNGGHWRPKREEQDVISWTVDDIFSDENINGDLCFLSEARGHGKTAREALQGAQ